MPTLSSGPAGWHPEATTRTAASARTPAATRTRTCGTRSSPLLDPHRYVADRHNERGSGRQLHCDPDSDGPRRAIETRGQRLTVSQPLASGNAFRGNRRVKHRTLEKGMPFVAGDETCGCGLSSWQGGWLRTGGAKKCAAVSRPVRSDSFPKTV